MKLLTRGLTALTLAFMLVPQADAFFVNGEGHYGLLGETRTSPAFSKETGTYQAIEPSFRLLGEARANDQLSFFMELRLFNDGDYLGDTPNAKDCKVSNQERADANPDDPCHGQHQNTGEPGYSPYVPKITKAYVRYAFDYCLLEAGRRDRDWGLGIFLDSGTNPFEKDASIFDGVTCHVNIQKSQTLGFSIGLDKLSETGTYVDPLDVGRNFGPNEPADDIDQIYFTIQYDDRKANAGAPFTKNIGVYFSQISSKSLKDGGSNTDLKFLDLFTGFFFTDLSIQNEILFRMGKSADPNWQSLGGADFESGGPATNKLQSIGFAGQVDWTMSRSGATIGPTEYNRGDASRHALVFDYAYAPGDSDGYYTNTDLTSSASVGERNADVTAIAFHENYKPALLLFNAKNADGLRVAGAFNANRVMNASVFGLSYRYESITSGDFQAKLVTASLLQSIPGPLKTYYEGLGDKATRPIGFYGKSLGYELDLSYDYRIGHDVVLGAAAGAAIPGNAWQTDEDMKPTNNFVVRSYAVFKF